MASYIERRKFLATLLGGAATWPLAARAQQTERMRCIGVLMGVADDAETKGWLVSFHKRLEQLGWRAGHDLQIEERWSAGDPERNRRFAVELLDMHPDVVFTFSSIAVAALQRESRSVPIVFMAAASCRVCRGRAATPPVLPILCLRWRPNGLKCSRRSRRKYGTPSCSSIRRPLPTSPSITSGHSSRRRPRSECGQAQRSCTSCRRSKRQ